MKLKITEIGTLPLQSEVKNIFHYCPETGVFTRLRRAASNAPAGKISGSLHKATGYIHLTINNKKYLAHRVAWLYIHGEWPKSAIDHINRSKSDNRIANLRIASAAENQQNRGKGKNNTSGHQGVHWDKRTSKWQAQIMVDRKCIYVGRFERLESAIQARDAAKKRVHTFQSQVAK